MDILTRRIDDLTTRVNTWESRVERLEGKIEALGQIFELKIGAVNASIGVWNKVGFALVSTLLTTFVVALAAFVISGGLRPLT